MTTITERLVFSLYSEVISNHFDRELPNTEERMSTVSTSLEMSYINVHSEKKKKISKQGLLPL